MTPCDRCNQAPTVRVSHGQRRRDLCVRCTAIVGATIVDEVRSGVDFLLATGNRPAIGAIRGIITEATR